MVFDIRARHNAPSAIRGAVPRFRLQCRSAPPTGHEMSDDRQLPTRVEPPEPKRSPTSEMRFPKLFVLVVILFVLDLLLPDVIPFVDEMILGALAVMLGMLKRKVRGDPDDDAPPPA